MTDIEQRGSQESSDSGSSPEFVESLEEQPQDPDQIDPENKDISHHNEKERPEILKENGSESSRYVHSHDKPDHTDGPPRKKHKKHKKHAPGSKSVINDTEQYRIFYNKELESFLSGTGPEEPPLVNSWVSGIRMARDRPKHIDSSTILGTLWTSLEKQIFFEFLGRYGISQVERIQEHLPKKSLLEIMTYYDILHDSLKATKESQYYCFKLVKYEDIPQAMEIDSLTLRIEEALSNKLLTDEGLNNSKEKQEIFEKNEIENDSEDGLINMKILNSMCEFYQMDHLTVDNLRFNETLTPRLGFGTGTVIKTHIERFVRDLVVEIIKKSLYQSTNAAYLKMNKEDEKVHQENFEFKISVLDVYKSFLEICSKRPFLLKNYFHRLMHRLNAKVGGLDFSLYNGGLLTFKRTSYSCPEYKRNELIKYIYGVPMKKLDAPPEDEVEKLLKDENEEEIKQADKMSRSRLAWKIFERETYEIEESDHSNSLRYCDELITQWRQNSKFKDWQESLGHEDENLEVEPTLEEIYRKIDEDESLENIEGIEDVEITHDMILLHGHTF